MKFLQARTGMIREGPSRQSLGPADPDGPGNGGTPFPPVQARGWDGPRLATVEYRTWIFHELKINDPFAAFQLSCIFQKETFENV